MCSVRRGPADPVGASRLHYIPCSNTGEGYFCLLGLVSIISLMNISGAKSSITRD